MIKAFIRMTGLVAAVLAVGNVASLAPLAPALMKEYGGVAIAFFAIVIVVEFLFLRAAYLAWFRYSPLAIRSICSLIAFVGFVVANHLAFPPSLQPNGAATLFFIGSMVFAWMAAKYSSERLIATEWPEGFDDKGAPSRQTP